MSNILVLGVGPLPFESGNKLYAPGMRTWQIATSLAQQKHFVTLCIIEFGDFHAGKKSVVTTAVRQDAGLNISLIRIAYNPVETAVALRTLHIATRFRSLISTSDIMNGLAVDLDLKIPIWLDYNGDPMAEKQLQANLYEHDGSLMPQWALYLKGLLQGDHFSVCSHPQRYALIGQLAYAGRLTGKNSGENLVTVLPNCSRFMVEKTAVRKVPLKGNRVPASAFLILWTGGYNAWCDTNTLFKGIETAMANHPSIFFASTGGAIDHHDTKSFQNFQDLVHDSPYRARFIFLGWLPTDEVGGYMEQADVALFADRPSVEGELGTRTRMIDWIQYNIPIVCTRLCELSRQMTDLNLIKTFPVGDHGALTQILLDMADNPKESQQRAIQAHQWFKTELDQSQAFEPLIKWSTNPAFASDKAQQQGNSDDKSWLSEIAKIQLHASQDVDFAPINGSANISGIISVKNRLRNFFSRKS